LICNIRGISLRGKLTGTTGHGIWLRARARIQDVFITEFKQNGIQVLASAGAGGSDEGNANNFYIDSVRVATCGGDGLFVQGADANAGMVSNGDFSSNSGWGVRDSSFLGNTYVAAHTAANTLGAYKTTNANGRNLLLNCYSESGQPASELVFPTMVLGGLHGAGFSSGSTAHIIYDSKISPTQLVTNDGSAKLNIGEGGGSNSVLLNLIDPNESSGSWPFRLKRKLGSFYWDWANSTTALQALYNSQATRANSYNRDVPAFSPNTTGAIGFPNGLLLGTMKALGTSTGSPNVQGRSYEVGDIYFNEAPTAGGYIGWVTTTAGTGGTLSSVTGSITSGTTALTVNSSTNLIVGHYITIAGVTGSKRITAINGTSVTIDTSANATVSNAAVAFTSPVLKTWGAITP